MNTTRSIATRYIAFLKIRVAPLRWVGLTAGMMTASGLTHAAVTPCEPTLPTTYYPDGRLNSYVELISEQVEPYIVNPPATMQQAFEGWNQESAMDCHYYTIAEHIPCPADHYVFPQDYIRHTLMEAEKGSWNVSSKDGANTTEDTQAALSLKRFIIDKAGFSDGIKNQIGYEDAASLSGERTLAHTLDFYVAPSQCLVQFWRLQHSRTTATYSSITKHIYSLRLNWVIYAGGGSHTFVSAGTYTEICEDGLEATAIYDGPKTIQRAPNFFCPQPNQAPIEYVEDFGGKTKVPCCQPFCNITSPDHQCCGCEYAR